MEIKRIINNQLTFGTSFTNDVFIKKNIQKVNTITLGICLYILFLCSKNLYDHNYLLVIVGLIDCLFFILNHITFRLHKKINLYFTFFAIVQGAAIIETLISGAYNGASLLLVSLAILSIMNTSGLKNGTLHVIFIICIELFIFKFHSRVDWIYTYPADIENIFFRFFTTQMGTYLIAFCNIKRENELYSQLVLEKETRNRLFVNVVHDLKTPLTIIHNCVDQFLKGDYTQDSKELLKYNIDKMQNDILNILKLHRLEQGLLVVNKNYISNISELTTNICNAFRPYIKSRNIELETKIEKELYIKIDQTSFTEILNNLLDNAIKYTEPHGKISLTLYSHSSNISISVEDTGIGIPESEQDRIFDYYYKAENSFGSPFGLGIGLALIKEICMTFGGRISMESNINVGSCFTVSFPKSSKRLYFEDKKFNETIPLIKHSFSTPQLLEYNNSLETILIVEDNEELSSLLINNLKDKYNLIVCKNGKDGINKYTSGSRIDLIITDLMMPIMDGKEFIKKLRKLNNKLITPIIIITAKCENMEVEEYLSLGAIDYICKPFSVNELCIKVESILNIFKNRQNSFKDKFSEDIMGFISNSFDSGRSMEKTINHEKLRNYSISKKEQRIIEKILIGMSYKEIAYQEGISLNTVKTYVYRIYKKCNINNSGDLIELFYSK